MATGCVGLHLKRFSGVGNPTGYKCLQNQGFPVANIIQSASQSHQAYMDQKRWNPFVALAILACFLTFEASAQFGGAFGGTRPGRGGAARGGETQGAPRESRNERPVVAPDVNSPEQIDYRLSLLQEDLKLVGEQNAVWHRFAGNAHAYVGDIARERSRGGGSPAVSAPPVGLQHIAAAVDGAGQLRE